MATTQEQWAPSLGFTIVGQPTAATVALSGADGKTWLAYSFVAPEALTLSKVKAYISAVAGSGTLTITCDLYSDVSGVPGASVAGPQSISVAVTGFAAGFFEWTGFTKALTGGTRYWLVFKNTTTTPGSNYPTFQFASGFTALNYLSTSATWGWSKVHTTDGSAWTQTPVASAAGYRLEFSDSSVLRWAGLPLSAFTTSAGAALGVYAARAIGVKFTSPANCRLAVRGVGFYFNYNSAGTLGDLVFNLYEGDATTPQATTTAVPIANITTTARLLAARFATTQYLKPNTVYRVAASSSGGDSSHYYRVMYHTCENDASSKALFPWGMLLCYLNSTWDDTNDTLLPPFFLLTDTDGEAGTVTFPAVGNVLTGSGLFGFISEYTPTLTLPLAAEVYPGATGASYGNPSSPRVGTLRASTLTAAGAPGVNLTSSMMLASFLVDNVQGNVALPSEEDVRLGVHYGSPP